jgi:hypothetical protein
MAVIEKLLTMGLAHGTDFERLLQAVPGATTPASERITWQDVMQAVAMVPKDQRAALYLKCAPNMVDAQEMAQFCFTLLAILQRFENKAGRPSIRPHSPQQWHTPAERAIHRAAAKAFERQASIVRTVLAEYQDPRICAPCKGKGELLAHVEGKGVVTLTCAKCVGHGWLAWSDRRRAKAIGVDRESGIYLTQVLPGYERLLSACTSKYQAGSKAFKEALFGPADDDSVVGVIESRLQARA